MAPALLATSKSKVKKSTESKQNTLKMDPETDCASRESVDFVKLRSKLFSEDNFITSLLENIPGRHSDPDQEDKSVDGDAAEDGEKDLEEAATTSSVRAADPDELKARLAAKLSQFQGKKLDFSGKQMKMKLKRRLHKLEKKKLKRKNSKMRSKIARLAQETKAREDVKASTTTTVTSVKTETPDPVQSRLPKPIFNNEGRMVFSKFDFGELTAHTSVSKQLTNDPKAALHKIRKVKEKIKALEEKGEVDKAKAIEEKKVWEAAIQRAEGVKVKDNVEMLTKSIKRKEHKKKASKKKWDKIKEDESKRKETQQKKRRANIKERKDKKTEKKLGRMAKRGKIII